MPIQIDSIAQRPDFIPELARWHDREWRHLNPEDYTLQARIKEYEQCLSSEKVPFMLVAYENNKPQGSVRLINDDMETHPEWFPWMASLYVHDKSRGMGIGASLIQAITKQAKLFGYETLYLFTENQQELYKKLGWKVLSNEDYYGEAVSVMTQDLTNLS